MINDLIALRNGSQLLAEAVDPNHARSQKVQTFGHKSKGSREIWMNSWKAEAGSYVRKSKIYNACWMTDSPVVNLLEQFQLGRAKSNIGLKLGSCNII